MNENAPSLEEQRALYHIMARAKEVAPWEWMDELDVFGVQNPETGEVGFVSIMGSLGEHIAIAVYLGAEGLYRFWELENAGPLIGPEMVLNTPHLQASFEDRDDVPAYDRNLIKQLGLKYRGKQAWPLFQSFAPGLVPWRLTAVEARFMHHALEQALEVAGRTKDDPDLLRNEDEMEYLVRVPHQKNGEWVWGDEIRTILPPPPKEFRLPMNPHAMAVLEHLPRTMGIIDVDFFWMPMPVGDRGERPYYPYMLIVVEPSSGFIMGSETMIADPSPDDMWAAVPMKVSEILARSRIRPKTMRVVSAPLASFLQPFAKLFDMEIKLLDELPDLENIKEMLMGLMGR